MKHHLDNFVGQSNGGKKEKIYKNKQKHFTTYALYQIILYTLNLYKVISQLCISVKQEKIQTKELEVGVTRHSK